jgi:NADH-quinone oxidoreductase subunit H
LIRQPGRWFGAGNWAESSPRMAEAIDQLFVTLKHAVTGEFPASWQPWVSAVLSVVALLVVFPLLFALTTVVERKLLGRIQNRYGPNRVGPFGFLQFAADGIKALTKEDVVPRAADQLVHFLAPVVLLVPVMLAYAVIPFGRNMAVIELDAGVLFFFAVGAATELAVFMAGWSSRNKYALLGAMRAIAQMISYEVPLILASVGVIMAVGSLSPTAIVAAQDVYTGWVPHWHVFTPWGLVGFGVFLVAAAAESNRSPFDIPEGESEIVAGYFIEYSGFKFALFFLAEYLGLFASCGMAVTLFLGGWTAPLSVLGWVPSWFWFFSKLGVLILGFIWVRGTLPRLRMDQLMNFAWKFLLPLALVALVTAGVWRYLPSGLVRWGVAAAMVGVPYVVLARGLMGAARRGRRVYRMAE